MDSDETQIVEGQGPSGLSRRELLTRTAVAGGLVWAAPVLLASPAGAVHDPCACHDGLIYFFKIPSQNAVNCGNITCTTLDNQENALCGTCLVDQGVVVIDQVVFDAGNLSFARITFSPDISLIQFCGQSTNNFLVVNCPGFADPTGQVTVTPNANGTTTIEIDPDADKPLNENGFIFCAPEGTPPPGC